MAKLQITDDQGNVLVSLDEKLENAFMEGTVDQNQNDLVPCLNRYSDLSLNRKNQIKNVFKAIIASLLKTANIPRALPVTKFTGTAIVAKITTGGTNGSLTFENGILVSRINPT